MPYDFKPLKVLIVDDDRHMGDLLRMVLRALGIDYVSICESSFEAFTYLENHEFDLAFIDFEIPNMTGCDLVVQIRAHHDDTIRFLPIIMWSSYVDEARVLQARDIGATEFLVKPFTIKAVYEHMASLIDRPRPFVQDGDYFGPDRRRKLEDFAGGDRRVTVAKSIEQSHLSGEI